MMSPDMSGSNHSEAEQDILIDNQKLLKVIFPYLLIHGIIYHAFQFNLFRKICLI